MTKPIAVGDLVMISKPVSCCGGTGGIGYVGTVESAPFVKDGHCLQCGRKGTPLVVWIGRTSPTSVDRLIRIDPPAQDESTSSDRQLKECV